MATLVFSMEAMGGMDEVHLLSIHREVLEPSWVRHLKEELASVSELWQGLLLLLPFVLAAWPWQWLV